MFWTAKIVLFYELANYFFVFLLNVFNRPFSASSLRVGFADEATPLKLAFGY
jgi:hypothetical protein